MVARFPAQISKLPPRLPAAGPRSTSDLTFQPADALSAFDSALLPLAEARGAHSVALSPLDSALTDCCLSYKQNAAVSPLESALTNASHLLDSTCFETACFDTLAQTSPASPLESALTKTPGGGGIPTRPRLQRPASSIEPPDCAYFPSPRGIPNDRFSDLQTCRHSLPLLSIVCSLFPQNTRGMGYASLSLRSPLATRPGEDCQ